MDDSLDQKLTSFVLQFRAKLDAESSFNKQTDYAPKSFKPAPPVSNPRPVEIVFAPFPADESEKQTPGAYFPAALPEYREPEQQPPVQMFPPVMLIIAGFTPSGSGTNINGTYIPLFQPQFLPSRIWRIYDSLGNPVVQVDFTPSPFGFTAQYNDPALGYTTVFLAGGTGYGPWSNTEPFGGGTARIEGSPY